MKPYVQIASKGRYNLFRPLTALLDLPKMPVFTALLP
jgi:hypothetical protein